MVKGITLPKLDKDKTRQIRQLRARRSRLGREWFERRNVVSWHVLCRYELHERRALEWTAEIVNITILIGPAFRASSITITYCTSRTSSEF